MENTFTIMPMSQQVNLTPGETYTGTITIVNPVDATQDFHYKMSISPYSVIGQDYTADLKTVTGRNEITNWITIEEPTGVVKPNESKKIQYTIKTPSNAAAGGQYAAITVSSNNDTVQSGGVAVNNVFEMASLIYANVSGDIVREGNILENNIPGFVAVPPIEVSALLENKGNIHESATVVLNVTNFFTGEVIFPKSEDNNEFNELVMPETTYLATRNITNLPSLGVVKVKQTIYFNGKSSVEERDVIICPIWFLLLVIACIAGIVGFIVMRIKKHKKKNDLSSM
ncbi:hypothetical protein IKG49_01775 [Candidatus Saccharibacteria bacterium]|nr:hypothetical protein [Candidatus Saccharibacteria bacterium]